MHNSDLRVALGFVALGLVILACSCPTDLFQVGWGQDKAESESWQEAVDEIKLLTRNQTIPKHLIDPEQPVVGEVFDPNLLLEPLDHLHLRSGYTLDFFYQYDGIWGQPFLYAREEGDAEPSGTYEDYQAALERCQDSGDTGGCDYLDFIEGDGTEESYFQWVVLQMMGDQFYLYWHSGYHDAEIVASQARLEELVESLDSTNFGEPLSGTQKRLALRVDPAPQVTIRDDEVIIRIVWFTKWGGFYERTIVLTPTAPYQVIDIQDEELVPYDCGIMF